MTAPTNQRLDGLDLARFLALGGMMLVNFRLAMHPPKGSPWLEAFFHFFEGKASATFVSLAGLGLVLATTSKSTLEAYSWVTRRALFLLVAGLLNLLVFPADIIHYYAAYFILALPWLKAGRTALAAGIVTVAAVSTYLLLTLDYGEGWDWNTLTYDSLWTLEGFVRNLLFNGFHPVLPWLAFFLTGMLMARLPLHLVRIQLAMVFGGIFLCLLAELVSHLGRHSAIAWTLHTSPMPPGIAYLLTGVQRHHRHWRVPAGLIEPGGGTMEIPASRRPHDADALPGPHPSWHGHAGGGRRAGRLPKSCSDYRLFGRIPRRLNPRGPLLESEVFAGAG